MRSFTIILSLIPIIISIILFVYFLISKMINFKTATLVSLMILTGTAFAIFMNYYFNWTNVVTLSDVIPSSLGIMAFLLMFIIFAAIKNNQFSVKNILPHITSLNFPTIALLLHVGIINLIVFMANIVKYMK